MHRDTREAGVAAPAEQWEPPPGTPPLNAAPAPAPWAVPAALIAALVGLMGGGVASGIISSQLVLLAVGGIGAAGVVLLAITRFEWFVWFIFAVRTSMDLVTGPGLGAGAMLAALFMLISSVWLAVQYRSGNWIPLSWASKALLGLAGAGALSLFTSVNLGLSANGSLQVLAGVLMFPVLEQLLGGRPDRLRRLVIALLLSTILPLAMGLQQWLTGHNYSAHVSVGRIQGSFVHPNPYATYLVSMLMLAVGLGLASVGRRRVGFLALSGLITLMVVVTYSRAGWIAALTGLTYLGFRKSRWFVAAIVVVLVGILLFVPSVSERLSDLQEEDRYIPVGVPSNSLEWRLQYWESLLPLAGDSPLTGIGLNVVPSITSAELEPHSVFVQAVVEMGFVGFTALAFALAGVALTLRQRRRSTVDRDPTAYTFSLIGIAAGLALLSQMPTENLLTQGMAYWYVAGAAGWGYQRHVVRMPPRVAKSEPRPEDTVVVV